MLRVLPVLLLVFFFVQTGIARAQEVTMAPDGQTFQNQSQSTQAAFMATFGPSCAQQEWTWQHTLAVDPDTFAGQPASDGQSFTDQDDDTQLPFIAWYGLQAPAEWVHEHNAVVAHRVVQDTVAPVPCPPARSARPADVIGTRHLANAVAAARAGDYRGVFKGFSDFKVIWRAARPKVAGRSASLAQAVQTAIDRANALVGDARAPAPDQAKYYAALQNLINVVRDANKELS